MEREDIRPLVSEGKITVTFPLNVDPQDVSDGYHSFRELYQHRLALSACLWNAWSAAKGEIKVCKSRRHHDGDLCFGGGWFVLARRSRP